LGGLLLGAIFGHGFGPGEPALQSSTGITNKVEIGSLNPIVDFLRAKNPTNPALLVCHNPAPTRCLFWTARLSIFTALNGTTPFPLL